MMEQFLSILNNSLMKKHLILCYSKTGNSKFIVFYVADLTEVVKRLGWLWGGRG